MKEKKDKLTHFVGVNISAKDFDLLNDIYLNNDIVFKSFADCVRFFLVYGLTTFVSKKVEKGGK